MLLHNQVRASMPIALRPSARALRLAGGISDVEKNWVPWSQNGSLLLSYSLEPHVVLVVPAAAVALAEAEADAASDAVLEADGGDDRAPPSPNPNRSADAPIPLHSATPRHRGPRVPVTTLHADLLHATKLSTAGGHDWEPSSPVVFSPDPKRRPLLRGGTPPVWLAGRYVAIMHTVYQRAGRSLYALAAYSFRAAPPYAIDAMSAPFSLSARPTPYPIGLLATRRHLYLSYGVEDSEWLIAKLDRQKLLDALVPVRTERLTSLPEEEEAKTADVDPADDGSLPHRLHFFRGAPESAQQDARNDVLRARQVERLVVGPDGLGARGSPVT